LPVDDAGQLRERLEAVLAPRLLGEPLDRLEPAGVDRRLQTVGELVDVEPQGPQVDRAHAGELVHRLAIGARRRARDLPALACVEAAVTPGHGAAGGEALEVPLPRTFQRLVEVVEVEHERAVGRGERPEVREVRVAAQLRADARHRGRGEIGGHDRGGAAIERERRGEHPAVADREQLPHAGGLLRLERVDRVRTPGTRLPLGVT
jgi:hypothetical protein